MRVVKFAIAAVLTLAPVGGAVLATAGPAGAAVTASAATAVHAHPYTCRVDCI